MWQDARARSDFAFLAPALERNLALAREYSACLDDGGHPYDALLADYDHGLTTERVQAIFGPLARRCPRWWPRRPRGRSRIDVRVPVARAAGGCPRGPAPAGCARGALAGRRLAAPVQPGLSTSDLRVTTRYTGTGLESLLAAVHEYGHALYESQIAPELARTNLGHGTSMSVHESQSKLWENHVARNSAFAAVMAAELAAGGVALDPEAVHRCSSRCARR